MDFQVCGKMALKQRKMCENQGMWLVHIYAERSQNKQCPVNIIVYCYGENLWRAL